MEGYIKVRKGSIESQILEKNKQHYINNGWELIEEEEKELPKDYNEYTVEQLKAICKNRKILPHKTDKKIDIIARLVKQDEQSKLTDKPSNKGFTDNLIIE